MRGLTLAVLLVAIAFGSEAPAEKTDLELMQGKWLLKVDSRIKGTRMRIEMEIVDARSTIKIADSNGRIVQVSRSDISINPAGPNGLHTYSWADGAITAGAVQGQKTSDDKAVYVLSESHLTEVFGLFGSDPQKIHTQEWVRLGADGKPAAAEKPKAPPAQPAAGDPKIGP